MRARGLGFFVETPARQIVSGIACMAAGGAATAAAIEGYPFAYTFAVWLVPGGLLLLLAGMGNFLQRRFRLSEHWAFEVPLGVGTALAWAGLIAICTWLYLEEREKNARWQRLGEELARQERSSALPAAAPEQSVKGQPPEAGAREHDEAIQALLAELDALAAPGMDMHLHRRSVAVVHVRTNSGQPLAGVDVVVASPIVRCLARTDLAGIIVAGGLLPATYRVSLAVDPVSTEVLRLPVAAGQTIEATLTVAPRDRWNNATAIPRAWPGEPALQQCAAEDGSRPPPEEDCDEEEDE